MVKLKSNGGHTESIASLTTVIMAQQLIAEIAAIHAKLCLPMTPNQKAD